MQSNYQAFVAIILLAASIVFAMHGKWVPAIVVVVAGTAYINLAMQKRAPTGKYDDSARYMDWAITTPLIVGTILLANRFSYKKIGYLMALDVLMIYSGYMAKKKMQEGEHHNGWMWFLISSVFFAPILYNLMLVERSKSLAYYTAALWFAYPIVWALAALNKMTPETTDYLYGLMDCMAKIGFGVFAMM